MAPSCEGKNNSQMASSHPSLERPADRWRRHRIRNATTGNRVRVRPPLFPQKSCPVVTWQQAAGVQGRVHVGQSERRPITWVVGRVRPIAPDLKSDVPQGTGGSNPSLPANKGTRAACTNSGCCRSVPQTGPSRGGMAPIRPALVGAQSPRRGGARNIGGRAVFTVWLLPAVRLSSPIGRGTGFRNQVVGVRIPG